jgi:hypothetical protein
VKRSERLRIKNEPLRPRNYCEADTLPKPQAAPAPTAAELAEQRELKIETAIRTNAVVFGLRSELAFEEKENKREREAMQQQFIRLQSRVERLEQDALAAFAKYSERWAVEATKHRAFLLDLVRNGQFCANAAAKHEDIVAEIDKKEIETCQTK